MKILLPFLLLAALYGCSVEERPKDANSDAINEANKEVTYDSLLAQKYGADQYGMRRYVIAFLKRGPNRPTDEKKSAELQAAHMSNIRQLAEAGKLALAGPFINDGDLRGIYVFNVETVEEARALTETDPAIQHAAYEKAEFNSEGITERLEKALFSEHPALYCLVVELDGQLIGYATYMERHLA